MKSFQNHQATFGSLAVLLSLFVSTASLAQDQRVLDVRVENDSTIPSRTLVLSADAAGELTHLKIYTAGQGVTSNYPADEFRSEAIVLYKSDPDLLAPSGRDIIRLDARLVTPEKGGTVRMTYATNALTGSFTGIDLSLERRDDGVWILLQGRTPVKALSIVKGNIGIKEIEFR